jgi:tripartite-type tricarboxylate transporter receptor subunit TctC
MDEVCNTTTKKCDRVGDRLVKTISPRGADKLYDKFTIGLDGSAGSDLLGGNIDAIVESITVTRQGISAGTLRGPGVTSAEPWSSLPDVPAIGAQVPGFEVMSWIGPAAPPGTPAPVLKRLNEIVRDTVASAAFQQRLDDLGIRARATSPTETRDFVVAEISRWNSVIDRTGLQRIDC